MNPVFEKIKKHKVILFPIIFSVCSFLTNIYANYSLNDLDYGSFAQFMFCISVIQSLGLIGVEQLIIRYSKKNEDVLFINKIIFKTIIASLLLVPFFVVYYIFFIGVIDFFDIELVLVVLFLSVLSLCFTYFNVIGRVEDSLIINGLWKLLFLIIFFISIGLGFSFDYTHIFYLSIMLSFLFLIKRKKVHFILINDGQKNKEFFVFHFTSVVSIVAYVAFESFDRNAINTMFEPAFFGFYYFVYVFISTPTSIIANYYSVLKLSSYKSDFSLRRILIDYLFISLMNLIVAALVLILLKMYFKFTNFSSDFISALDFIIIVFICVVRSSYSILSGAYRVVTSAFTLFLNGLIFGIFTLLLISILNLGFFSMSFTNVLTLILLLWVARTIAYAIAIIIDGKRYLRHEC